MNSNSTGRVTTGFFTLVSFLATAILGANAQVAHAGEATLTASPSQQAQVDAIMQSSPDTLYEYFVPRKGTVVKLTTEDAAAVTAVLSNVSPQVKEDFVTTVSIIRKLTSAEFSHAMETGVLPLEKLSDGERNFLSEKGEVLGRNADGKRRGLFNWLLAAVITVVTVAAGVISGGILGMGNRIRSVVRSLFLCRYGRAGLVPIAPAV